LDYRLRWTRFDLKEANRLLDDIGLAKRNDQGIRLLSDGRPLHIVIETAGQTTEQTDILELIRDSWLKAGIKLYIKPMQIDVLRNRVFSGEAVMTIGFGIENGLVAVDSNPWEFAPTEQQQLQWSKWGQYFETKGRSGEAVDIAEAKELVDLKSAWRRGADRETRRRVWDRILEINADQLFTIGLVAGALQPVVVSDRLKNVPDQGLYNWDPGAHFGIHRPDTFWLADRMPELRASASQRR
jgi:peptide/nickel transport system substrate-binding protein